MSTPYSIIPIGIIALVLYLLSLTISRAGLVKTITHRRIWNVLLALSFFCTAIPGIFLAIQINYKLDIPWIDQLTILHVDFGISMVMIAIFHFTWHIKYYTGTFSRKKKRTEKQESPEYNNNNGFIAAGIKGFSISLIVLGITSLVTQIIILREFLSVFMGNELVIGIILANWMLITGFGSYLGRFVNRIKDPVRVSFFAQIGMGMLPFITVFLLNYLRNSVFLPGSLAGGLEIFAASFILLLPFCMLSGFLFTFFTSGLSSVHKNKRIDISYALESSGSLIGGILFSFILVFLISPFRVLIILLLLNLFVALWVNSYYRKTIVLLLSFVVVAISLFTFFLPLDRFVKGFLYPNQDIIYLNETPFGNLTVTKTGEQYNFYENHVLLFNTMNYIANEEAVHYAMVQHENPENILVISGGVSGIMKEIMKYSAVKEVDYVELNPRLVKVGEKYYGKLEDRRIHVFNKDARLFIKDNPDTYDVVLANLPPPSTASLNRYYTIEFFKQVKDCMSNTGVLSINLPSTGNYAGKEANIVNSLIFNTLKQVFKNVILIPGEQNYWVASNNVVDFDIAGKIEEKGIENRYVNHYYIDDKLLNDRSNFFTNQFDIDTGINRDLEPSAYFHQISSWLSYYQLNMRVFGGIILVVMLLLMSRLNLIQAGMFTGGFAASSSEVILLIAFQIIYGYVYLMSGVIIAVFMGGLALGALAGRKIIRAPGPVSYSRNQLAIGLFALFLPLVISALEPVTDYPFVVHSVFLFLTIAISFLVGTLFSTGSKIQKGNVFSVTSAIYSADLAGSAFGALIVSVFLLPLVGLVKASIAVGLINIIFAGITWINRKKVQVAKN